MKKNSATFSTLRLAARCVVGARVLARYANGGRPDARVLSDGWIASPHYWAA